MNKYAVVFIGGVENTPKVAKVYESLAKRFGPVDLITLSKHGYGVGKGYSYNASNKYLKTLRFLLAGLFVLLRLARCRPTRVYAINPFAGVIVSLYAFIFRQQYYYESLEIFVGSNNPFYANKWFRPYFCWLERKVAYRAKYFVTTDQFRMRFLRRFYKIPAEKCVYLYNTRDFLNTCQSKSHVEYKRPIVSYCGSLMPGRGIEEIIRAFSAFDGGGTLWLVGGCDSESYRMKLQSIIEDCGIGEKVVFMGQVSNAKIFSHMQESDITFALYKRNCVNNRLCSPNKYFDAIASGVKLITVKCFLSNFLRKNGALIYTVEDISVHDILTAFQVCCSGAFNSCFSEIVKKEFDWKNEEKKLINYLTV